MKKKKKKISLKFKLIGTNLYNSDIMNQALKHSKKNNK